MAWVQAVVVGGLLVRPSHKWYVPLVSTGVRMRTCLKTRPFSGPQLLRPQDTTQKRNLSTESQHSFAGKTALVTGSTSGIGLGITENLAQHGVNVVITGLGDPDDIKRIVSDLGRNHGVKSNFIGADLTNIEEIDGLCGAVNKLYPDGIDILVNNAGLQYVCDVETFPKDKWDLLIAVMLSAPFHLIQKFLPYMRNKGWGRIVNLASAHAIVASPFKSAYCAAKHGIVGLTKVVALETAGSGVTCNAICPGYVDTEFKSDSVVMAAHDARGESDSTQSRVRKSSIPEGKEKNAEVFSELFLAQFHPTKQAVTISQVAEFVNFVCSKSADQMTGTVLPMDSGWTAR